MSIFGYYYVGSLLREAGWPREQGLFKRLAYDTTMADAAIDQMVNWAASLGAGRPALALQIITEMFRDRNWNGDDAPQIDTFISDARKSWDKAPNAAPREIVRSFRLASAFGAAISPKNFQDARVRVALEQNVLEALLWGLANPDRFTMWYADARQRNESSLGLMQSSGLAVDTLPALSEFLEQSEQIVRNYEHDVGPLPTIPTKLLSDARALGIKVNEAG